MLLRCERVVIRGVQVSIEAVHNIVLFGRCLLKIYFLGLRIRSCSLHQLLIKNVCLNETEGPRN